LCRGFRRLGIRTLEKMRHHRRKHLDVSDFLSADIQQHVAVLASTTAVPALEEILQGNGHLAPLSADHLLEFHSEERIGTVWLGSILQVFVVTEHSSMIC